jgi:preprotein translocase subunit YajC
LDSTIFQTIITKPNVQYAQKKKNRGYALLSGIAATTIGGILVTIVVAIQPTTLGIKVCSGAKMSEGYDQEVGRNEIPYIAI